MKNLLGRQHGIAMDDHRILHAPRIAARIGNHDRDAPRLRHVQHQFVALLQSFNRHRQSAQLVFFIRIGSGDVAKQFRFKNGGRPNSVTDRASQDTRHHWFRRAG